MISLPDPLPNDPDLLKQMLRDAVVGRQADQNTIAQLQEQVSLLRQRLFGRKSEQSTDPNSPQLGMFNEAENLAEASPTAEDEEIVAPEPAKKRGKRKPLPAELPRVEVMHELPEQKTGSAASNFSKCSNLLYCPLNCFLSMDISCI